MKKTSVLIRHCFSVACVILERSEESRSLFFGLFFGLFFVSFRAAAAKNPASVSFYGAALKTQRSGFFAPQTPL